ncbi:MAG: hypothetical protein ACOC44_18370 [Promethearchaeia archaeon]
MKNSILRWFFPILYVLLTIGYFLVVTLLIFRQVIKDFILLIPGNYRTDILVLFIGGPIFMLILVLFSRFIALINFKFTSLFQRNYEYYYVKISERSLPIRHLLTRPLLPVFICIAIAQLINSVPFFTQFITGEIVTSIIFLALLIAPLSLLLLLPIWIFKDAGVVKIRKKTEIRVPPELNYYGNFYYHSYKGFAGITTVISYFVIIYPAIQSLNITTLVILLFPPFFMGLYVPFLLIYEKRISKISRKLVKNLNLEPLNYQILQNNITLERKNSE